MGRAEKETDARIIVDRLLRESGWDPEDKSQVLTEEPAADGSADYVLLDSRGRPLAVVEAKRFSKDPYSARQQARDYAEALEAPFIFLSNGETTYFWDYTVTDARQVVAFFPRRDLERIMTLRRFRKPLSTVPIPEEVFIQGEEKRVRPYQKQCLQAMDAAIETGKRRLLIEMATATGKTLTIAMALKRFFQAGVTQRVLFLVDRLELANQAKEVFNDHLKDFPSVVLYGGRRSKEGQIVIALYWQQIVLHKQGAAQPNVNSRRLKTIRLYLPPLPVQQRIVAKLDHIERALKFQQEGLKKMETLMQTALHRAFRGEL
ncbi:MAG: DEAD/DEAH box helicase family protein [Candidatus Bipolaricaulia bacterium]